MSAWAEIEKSEPEFATRVRALFDGKRHKTMATLRKDGAPRISGIETTFSAGDFVLGMMPGSVKAADLLRDPRVAVQVTSDDPSDDDPSAWPGDAKISGRAIEGSGPDGTTQDAVWFHVDIGEVVLTKVGTPADHLLIESWHPERGLQRRERR